MKLFNPVSIFKMLSCLSLFGSSKAYTPLFNRLCAFSLVLVATMVVVPLTYAGSVTVNGEQRASDIEVESAGGLQVRNADGTSGFNFNGILQVDATGHDGPFNKRSLDVAGEGNSSSEFDLRRLRFNMDAFTGNWHFSLGYDYQDTGERLYSSDTLPATSTSTVAVLNNDSESGITDIYAQYRFHPWAWLTFGRHKMPFSMDYLTASGDTLMFERNILSNAFSIRRQAGISVRGHGNSNFSYNFAVFQEDSEHFGAFYDADDKNKWSTALRLTSWYEADNGSSFHFGFAWANRNLRQGDASAIGDVTVINSYSIRSNNNSILGTISSGLVFESEAHNADLLRAGPVAYDHVNAVALEFAFALESFYMKSELMEVEYDEQVVGSGATLDGYSMEFAWVITGEIRPYDEATGTYGRIVPRKKRAGAWELVARYSAINLDTNTSLRSRNFTPADNYKAWTIGFNWYASNNVRLGLNAIDATIGQSGNSSLIEPDSTGGAAGDTNLFINTSNSGTAYQFRVQYAF